MYRVHWEHGILAAGFLYERQCGDIAYGSGSLADAAREALVRYGKLAVGTLVPEIAGEDVHGRRMNLSDYRGKVVLLDFWTSSCMPCMRMKPYERDLCKRMADKPFVLLGVACDDDRARLKKVMDEKEVSWRCWWAGGSNNDSICSRWTVRLFPTLYLIDSEGILRARFEGFPGEESLDKAIDSIIDD